MLTQEEKTRLRLEKKEKIIRIRKTLAQMTEEQRNAIAEKYGIVTVEGHLLTAHNQCFLVAQSEINFTIVDGYQQWKKAGRNVRKGEHGFLIFVPSKQRESVPTGKDEPENQTNHFLDSDEDVRFYTATVFDISQTDLLASGEINSQPKEAA